MAANRTPVPLRLLRLARLALHLLRGLAIAWLRYPKLSEAERQVEKRRWSNTLLSILSVSVREKNAPKELPDRCMLVLNHISWVDIFVVDARFPATFIAKSEIRNWPMVGWLSTLVGTLYIERGKRSEVRRTRQIIAAEIERCAISIPPAGTPMPPAMSGTPRSSKRSGPSSRRVTWSRSSIFSRRFPYGHRSEEHTSELQSRRDLVCRLLLEKKKKQMHPLPQQQKHTAHPKLLTDLYLDPRRSNVGNGRLQSISCAFR